MKTGVEETKRFFNNKDFKWFERKEIRDEEKLSQEEIKHVRRWTLSPLGPATIFYLGYRKLYDIAFVWIVTYIFFEVHEQFLRPLLINDSATTIADKYELGIIAAIIYFLFIVIPFVMASFYATYFMLRHGRRLSWNRGKWESFDELKKSEKKWFYFNTIPALVLLALLSFTIFDSVEDFIFDKILFNPIFFSGAFLLILGIAYPLYKRRTSSDSTKNNLLSKQTLAPIIIAVLAFLVIAYIYFFGGDILNLSPF